MDRCDMVVPARAIRSLCASILKTDRQENLLSLASAGIDISPSQYLVLRYLNDQPMTLTQLSHTMNLDPSTLVPIVDSLVKREFLQRNRSPEDRRCTHLELTAGGVKLLSLAAHLDESGALVKGLCLLGADKGKQLVDLLNDYEKSISTGEDIEDKPILQVQE
jgi:DNA-binding MarR family transcriptional regulator